MAHHKHHHHPHHRTHTAAEVKAEIAQTQPETNIFSAIGNGFKATGRTIAKFAAGGFNDEVEHKAKAAVYKAREISRDVATTVKSYFPDAPEHWGDIKHTTLEAELAKHPENTLIYQEQEKIGSKSYGTVACITDGQLNKFAVLSGGVKNGAAEYTHTGSSHARKIVSFLDGSDAPRKFTDFQNKDVRFIATLNDVDGSGRSGIAFHPPVPYRIGGQVKVNVSEGCYICASDESVHYHDFFRNNYQKISFITAPPVNVAKLEQAQLLAADFKTDKHHATSRSASAINLPTDAELMANRVVKR